MMQEFIPQIIASLISIIVLWLCKMLSSKLISKYGARTQKTEIRMKQIRQVISILLNILFIFVIAIIWGVEPRNLLVVLSSILAVLGVALFAQWSILSNISAGIIMFFGAPFRIGDRIRIIDKDVPIEAVIESINTFYTHIRTNDNEIIVIPNNLFLQKMVSVKKDEDIW